LNWSPLPCRVEPALWSHSGVSAINILGLKKCLKKTKLVVKLAHSASAL
jgi:hypothetical protein